MIAASTSGDGYWREGIGPLRGREQDLHENLVAGTLEATSGKSRGAGTPPGMLAFGGNNTSGELEVSTAVRAKGGTGHGDFESETFVLQTRGSNVSVEDDFSGMIGSNADRASGGAPIVIAFEPRERGDDGRGYDREPNFSENISPAVNTVKTPVIAFDTTQITHPENRSRPDDRSPQLSQSGHPPAIAFSTKESGADASLEITPTLRAESGDPHMGGRMAVAFDCKAGGDTSFSISDHTAGALRGEGHGGGHAAVAVDPETRHDVEHGTPSEADAVEALRALRRQVGEEAFSQWGSGIIAAFWPQEILQSKVHGCSLRCPTEPEHGLVNYTLSRQKNLSSGIMPSLWQAGCDGRAPRRWRPHEQLAEQLGAYLSRLPYSPSPAERLMRALWASCEGPGLLRETLSAIQEARRSSCSEGQPVRRGASGRSAESDQALRDAGVRPEVPRERILLEARAADETRSGASVRRLTAEECEALQAFPRGYTLIHFRGKPAADGPRYRSCGNSMCCSEIKWILTRIEMFEGLKK